MVKLYHSVKIKSMELGENQIEDSVKIFRELQKKFNSNLEISLVERVEKFSQVEIKARAFAIVCQALQKKHNISQSQQEIIKIFDEVFVDVVISVYLAGCSLDKPAQTLLRRVLELGVAIIYLWDMPHLFWAWKCHDKDLSFNTMIEHIDSNGYKSFVLSENSEGSGEKLFDIEECKKLYRDLSNTVHGKIFTFESILPDRFKHSSSDWNNHLVLVEKVQDLLLTLWKNRFSDTFSELKEKLPSIY